MPTTQLYIRNRIESTPYVIKPSAEISSLYRYFFKWKNKINDTKTESIIFTKTEYFGMLLDRRPNFSVRINYVTQRTLQRFFSLSSTVIRIYLYLLIQISPTLCRPVQCFVSRSNANNLQKIQNHSVRIILNKAGYFKISTTHNIIQEIVKDRAKNFYTCETLT